MPANVSPCIPVRVKMRLQAAMLWAILSIPSILVTIILFISTNKSEFKESKVTLAGVAVGDQYIELCYSQGIPM